MSESEDLVKTIKEVRQLIAAGENEELSEFLYNTVCGENDIDLMVAALRSAYTARSKIPDWRRIVDLAKTYAESCGSTDPDRVFKGL